MNALVIGYGSIGARHARLLGDMGVSVGIVSKHLPHKPLENQFSSLEDGMAKLDPGYVVVANTTDLHYDTLVALERIGYRKIVLSEKPLFDQLKEFGSQNLANMQNIFVGYNLRFHPILMELRELLAGKKIISATFYAGQYLPTWRSSTDYSASYSASKTKGGGVLRDLSHELDYALWLLGDWKRVTALGGHFSDLKISSDDTYSLLFETKACPVVNININYLDQNTRRFIIIHLPDKTIEADLVRGTLTVNSETTSFSVTRDSTYIAMHSSLLDGNAGTACSYAEAENVLRLIVAAEESVASNRWIAN